MTAWDRELAIGIRSVGVLTDAPIMDTDTSLIDSHQTMGKRQGHLAPLTNLTLILTIGVVHLVARVVEIERESKIMTVVYL